MLGFVSTLTVSILDKVGMKQLGLDTIIQQESKMWYVVLFHLHPGNPRCRSTVFGAQGRLQQQEPVLARRGHSHPSVQP